MNVESHPIPVEPIVQYRPVPGFPGYRVGDDGSVWTQKRKGRSRTFGEWRLMCACPDTYDYLQVHLSHEGKGKMFLVHHLVLLAFGIERPSLKHETRHMNGKKSDNRLSNIAWGTPKQNMDDQVRHGTRICGERHRDARLKEADIRSIRTDFPGMTDVDVAKIFKVTTGHICRIRNRKKWKHII